MKYRMNVVVALLVTVTLLLSATPAWSTPMVEITYVETSSAGAWQYAFTFANTSDSVADAGANLYSVNMSLFVSTPDITAGLPAGWCLPTGWEVYTYTTQDYNDPTGQLDFYSIFPSDGSDIAPGDSLGDFIVVLSQQLPASLGGSLPVFSVDLQEGTPYFTAFLTSPAGGDPLPYPAQSTAVPEPSTLLLLGGGLLGMLVIARRR